MAANTTHIVGIHHTWAGSSRLTMILPRKFEAASHGFTSAYSTARRTSAAVSTLPGRDSSVGSRSIR